MARYDVHNVVELAATIEILTDKRRETSSEKSKVYRARARCENLFVIGGEMEVLKPAEESFQKGDNFMEEHNKWIALLEKLRNEGYSLEEVEELRRYYKEQIASASVKEKAVFRELESWKIYLKILIRK